MDRKEIITKLQEIIREAVDDEDVVINDTTVASDVDGWDSLSQVIIMGEIQNELGIKLTSSEIGNLSNVGELVEVILSKI